MHEVSILEIMDSTFEDSFKLEDFFENLNDAANLIINPTSDTTLKYASN